MFVLGIDPGLSRCGYAVLRSERAGRAQPVSIGVVRTPREHTTPERLAELQREICSLLDEFRPDVVAVERVYFQNNVQTAVSVAQALGIVLAEAAQRRLRIEEYSPNQIKAAVAGDGRADKTQMQTMVRSLLGLAALPKPADAADAAAIALCYLAHNPAGLSRRVPRPPIGSSL